MNDFLAMIPGLRRVVYLDRLFDWLGHSLEASRTSTINGYPEVPLLLIESLERAGQEIASVSLLKYCEQLRGLNSRIRNANAAGAAARIDLQFDHLPLITEQYKTVRRDCLKADATWLFIPLIVLILAIRYCG
jgi:hypothetical protein